jgi:hypothetical protein
MVPNACVRSKRHEIISATRKLHVPRLCLEKSATVASLASLVGLEPSTLIINTQGKSGHAAELNRPDDRIAYGEKANFSLSRARAAAPLLACCVFPPKSPTKRAAQGETR